MRALGLAERALTALIRRSQQRVAFGKPLSEHEAVSMLSQPIQSSLRY
jgi:alkylation response protein AidB-like acyl-CoA dehydrogenase